MASVQEIIDRLAEEDPFYGTFRPGLGVEDTHSLDVTEPDLGEPMSWVPNRKVVSGAIAGVLAWASLKYLGSPLDAELASALTGLIMTGISYLVPLPKDE